MQSVPLRQAFAARHEAVRKRAVFLAVRAPVQPVGALGTEVPVRDWVAAFFAFHVISHPIT